MTTRSLMTPDAFGDWGWRVPFLISVFLLGISLWIRLKLHESPVFEQLRNEGALSKSPLREAFLHWPNLKIVLIALFGNVAGQAVLFYTSTIYAFYFLERMAKVDGFTATALFGCALAISAPLIFAFGWLGDRIGRKPLVIGSAVLGAMLYFPLFGALLSAANPVLARAQETAPVIVHADPKDCSLQFDPVGRKRFDASGCDIVKAYLAHAGVSHETRRLTTPGPARLEIGAVALIAPDPAGLGGAELAAAIAAFQARMQRALDDAGYHPRVVAILVALLAISAMSLGVYAAVLVELFPARIRYSALSLPQNFGNGWFGGLLPAVAFAIVAATGNIYAGLWYPLIIAGLCAIVAQLALPETRGRSIR
jgi:MFS family permease